MENKDGEKIKKPGPLKYLLLSASLGSDSLNTKLIKLAAEAVKKNGGIVDLAGMSEFDSVSFNHDLELKDIRPEQVKEFNKRILANDAIIISSPEYNNSIPGHLKNAIDWVSRYKPQPFNERNILLMSASPSMVGGNRGLWSLRIPFEHLGARVYPNMFSLAMAHKAFTPEGKIADETLAKHFEENILAFMELAEASIHYPCLKQIWIEFLGEKPDPKTERIQ